MSPHCEYVEISVDFIIVGSRQVVVNPSFSRVPGRAGSGRRGSVRCFDLALLLEAGQAEGAFWHVYVEIEVEVEHLGLVPFFVYGAPR